MGTIIPRRRKDGTTRYSAQIVKKQAGKIIWREAKTFKTAREAKSWAALRERELDKAGALEALLRPDVTLADAIDKYVDERAQIGKTKAQVLRAIKNAPLAKMECSSIKSADIVAFASAMGKGRKPQTVANYVSHLAAVFRDAKAAWGYPLDYTEMSAAQQVLARLGKTSKSSKRDRRPSVDEMNLLAEHFAARSRRAAQSSPMHIIIAFALFSTRRLEEICRIKWADLSRQSKRVVVRDMKHPGQKRGNDVRVDLPEEAMALIDLMPEADERIFPYSPEAIGAAFTRACKVLGIRDLHFHDLRHEGVSRLFEMAMTIPQVAAVSGHRSWASLQRYTHIDATGDKWEGWLAEKTKTWPLPRRISKKSPTL